MRAPPTCRNPAGDGANANAHGSGRRRSHDNYVSGPALFGNPRLFPRSTRRFASQSGSAQGPVPACTPSQTAQLVRKRNARSHFRP